jgi:spore coat protein A
MKNIGSMNRREFLYRTGAAAAALSHPRLLLQQKEVYARRQFDASTLARFVDPLPIPPVLKPTDFRPSPPYSERKVPFYRLAMRPAETKLHRDLKPTRFWGFNGLFPGPTIEARAGQPVLVEWTNNLPASHMFPLDHNLEGAAAGKPEVRAVVHLHGARVPPESDGYPEHWFVPGQSSACFYPNNQESATLWYHDHAMGINRLNIYAGLFGMFLIRDSFEDGLNLPSGKYEIPLVLSDRQLDMEGQFLYPVSPDPERPWVPEVFGDAMLVNGKISPYCDVEPRPYRFRLLNGANGRFFHLAFENHEEFQQIGSDQGLLGAPVTMKLLTIGPGERADLIVDFSRHAGENLVLKSDQLSAVQFRVAGKSMPVAVPAIAAIPQTLRPVVRTPESDAIKTRELLIEETRDHAGNPTIMLLDRKRWMDPVSENPTLGSTEIWTIVNGTDDSHPIHLHLVRFQILDRRNFFVLRYLQKRTLIYTGPPLPPDPNELGWKDTVRAESAMVTRIIVKFDGYPGRYVWHCHILEHEDNEMMRPFEVIAPK